MRVRNKKEKVCYIAGIVCICLLFALGCMELERLVKKRDQNKQTESMAVAEPDVQSPLSKVKLVENEEVVGYEDRAFYRFTFEEESVQNTASLVSKLQESCSALQQIYVIPIPPRIIAEEGCKSDKEQYQSFINQLKQAMPKNSILLDISQRMIQHSLEEIFYRTDNTWTSRGAYYGMQVFLEKTGRKSIPLEQYEEYIGNRFKGKVEAQKEIAALKEEGTFQANNLLYYYWLKGLPQQAEIIRFHKVEGEERYKKPLFTPSSINLSSVIEDEYDRAIVEGESLDGKKTDQYLLVINDRAGAWSVPYLKDYYDGIYVINIHEDSFLYRDIESIVEEYRISEVLWVQNAMELGKKGYYKALSF